MKQSILLYSVLLLLFCGCDPMAGNQQKDALQYFDLKGYVRREAIRLQKSKILINKTVSIDASAETRSLRIADWQKELAALTDADINKASWKGLFSVKKEKDEVIYQSTSEKVPIKRISIKYKHQVPSRIVVLIENSNMLYSSADTLTYCPDSLYDLRKEQKIRLFSPKRYRISLKFR